MITGSGRQREVLLENSSQVAYTQTQATCVVPWRNSAVSEKFKLLIWVHATMGRKNE